MADHPTNKATDEPKESEQTVVSPPANLAVDDLISGAMSAAIEYLEKNVPKNNSPAGQDAASNTPTVVLPQVEQPSHLLREALRLQVQLLQGPTTTDQDALSMAATKGNGSADIPRETIENIHPAWSLAEAQYAEPFFQRPDSFMSATPSVFSGIGRSISRNRSVTLAIRSSTPGPFGLSGQTTPQPPTRESTLGVGNVNPNNSRQTARNVHPGPPRNPSLAAGSVSADPLTTAAPFVPPIPQQRDIRLAEDPYAKALAATKSYPLGKKSTSQTALQQKGTWYIPKAGQNDPKKVYFCCICLAGFTDKSGLKTRHFPTCEKRHGNPFNLPWDTHPSCQNDDEGLAKVRALGSFLNGWHQENDLIPQNARPADRMRKAPSGLQNVSVSASEGLSDERQAKRSRVTEPKWEEREEWDERGFDHHGWKVINRRFRVLKTNKDEEGDKEDIGGSEGNKSGNNDEDDEDDEDNGDDGDDEMVEDDEEETLE